MAGNGCATRNNNVITLATEDSGPLSVPLLLHEWSSRDVVIALTVTYVQEIWRVLCLEIPRTSALFLFLLFTQVTDRPTSEPISGSSSECESMPFLAPEQAKAFT